MKITHETIVVVERFKTPNGAGIGIFKTLEGELILDQTFEGAIPQNATVKSTAYSFGALRTKFGWSIIPISDVIYFKPEKEAPTLPLDAIQDEIAENYSALRNKEIDPYDFMGELSNKYFKHIDMRLDDREGDPYTGLLCAIFEINNIELH